MTGTMRSLTFGAAVALLIAANVTRTTLVAGPLASSQAVLETTVLAPPVGVMSSQPNMSVDSAGNVYLVWVERGSDNSVPPTLKFAKYNFTSWSPVGTISSDRGMIVNSADIPSLIALPSGRLVAHWLQSGATRGGYGVRISQSSDGGASWSTPIVPHAGHETGENGFVSTFAHSRDSAGVVWLDGRNYGNSAGATRQSMMMSLLFSSAGRTTVETTIDERVCDCCQTSFAVASRGPVVVYRDRSDDEIRDVSLVQLENGKWSAARVVHSDGWRLRACPVNGPAVAASGNAVAVAWFTAARDTAKVLVSFSGDGAQRFAASLRVDGGDPVGRVGVVLANPTTAWVSWVERTAGGPALRIRRVNSSGANSPVYTLQSAPMAVQSGFPQMVMSKGELILAWPSAARAGLPPTVVVARAKISGR